MRNLVLLLAMSTIAPPAMAQSDAATRAHNVQCLILSAAASQDPREEVKKAATMGSLFFAGQIFGADPDIDLAAATTAELASLTPEKIGTLRVQCGAELSRRGKQIMAAGEAMKQKTQAASPSGR